MLTMEEATKRKPLSSKKHPDEVQDKKLIRRMVKSSALKKKGKK